MKTEGQFPEVHISLETLDRRAQEVMNSWGFQTKAGIHLSDAFMSLFDAVCLYRDSRGLANNRREFNHLTAKVAAEEEAAGIAFEKAYSAYAKNRNNLQ